MKRSVFGKLLKYMFRAAAAVLAFIIVANAVVWMSSKNKIRAAEDDQTNAGCDCIIVLGCGVWGETPTPLLSDRLDTAIALYKAGAAPKLLMSGDHGRKDYNEVSVMRTYAIAEGVPSEDIFMDHAGFSTYETMVRAHDIFGVKKAVVVTQKYHLFRALYDASAFGIEVSGVSATGHSFASSLQLMWSAREVLARTKDFIWCIVKPNPTYRGEPIDISGNGEVTLD